MNNRNGFSLIELLISIAVMAIVGSAVLAALVSMTQLTSTQNRNMVNAEEVRTVLTFMGDEIAMMGNRVANPVIDIAEPQELRFYSNIDNDFANVIERIHYHVEGNQLKREFAQFDGTDYVVLADDVLIEHLLSNPPFGFTYYAIDNTAPASTAAITSIEMRAGIDVEADATAWNKGRIAPQNMVQRATIRNRTMF